MSTWKIVQKSSTVHDAKARLKSFGQQPELNLAQFRACQCGKVKGCKLIHLSVNIQFRRSSVMALQNTARLFQAVKKDQALKAKLKATANPEAFIKIARESGYDFTVEELEREIDKLSDEDLAAIVNPGWGTRRHIYPR